MLTPRQQPLPPQSHFDVPNKARGEWKTPSFRPNYAALLVAALLLVAGGRANGKNHEWTNMDGSRTEATNRTKDKRPHYYLFEFESSEFFREMNHREKEMLANVLRTSSIYV